MVKRTLLVVSAILLASCGKTATSPGPQVGRWATFIARTERDTVLLDMATANTWGLVTLGGNENSGNGWQFIGRLDGPETGSPDIAAGAPKQQPADKSGGQGGSALKFTPDQSAPDAPKSDGESEAVTNQ